MILTSNGLDTGKLTPEFARLLGDGDGVVAQAAATSCEKIEPVHFLGYLAEAGGSALRTEFLEPRRVDLGMFLENLYNVALPHDRVVGVPLGFHEDSLSADSISLLQRFESEMEQRQLTQGSEGLFLVALREHLDESCIRMLTAISGSEEAVEKFFAAQERRIGGPARTGVFDATTGRLVESEFDKSGRRALNMLKEETAALGYKKVTMKHLLYALVGIENGILQRAIQIQAVDPVRDVHGFLSRELTRLGAKRTPDFDLNKATMHESVVKALEIAAAQAHREGVKIGELHLARAAVAGRSDVVSEFLLSRKVNTEALRDYLAELDYEAEEASENLRLPLTQIEAELQKRILGQNHAIGQILPWIKRLRFNFPKDRGPAAVLLFLGPSGTGKTQLAKELARTVYGSEEEMVMLEMGQFNAKESINIFIGSPPGYVGYGEGKLTNGLRDKPQAVVLFDEIEKAHEDVWVALLRFLDEGLISDPAGPTRDGRKCIVVLTSNLGADTLAKQLPPDTGADFQMTQDLEQSIRDTVLPYLKRPEIYNRVDDKVIFRPFSPETYRDMVQRQVDSEARKFHDLHGVSVEVEREVIEFLADLATQAKQEGARCVPRIVNRYVITKVIDVMAQNEGESITKVIVSLDGNNTRAETPRNRP